MKNPIRKTFCLLMALGLLAPAALAQRNTAELVADGWVLWDYPSIPTTTAPDTVTEVTYPWAAGGSDSIIQGDQALYLGEEARAWYRFADTPVFGELSFLVYDKGTSFVRAYSSYGPRWGVQNNPAPNSVNPSNPMNDQLMSVELTAKSFMDANVTYAFVNGNASDTSSAGSHFSPVWPGGFEGASAGQSAQRRVAGTLPTDVAVYDAADNVQGAWARWSFSIHDGEDMTFKVTDPDGSNEQSWTVIPATDSVFDTGYSTTGFNQVFFYGGRVVSYGTADHVGVWIDDITFTPDAGQGIDAWAETFDANDDPPVNECEIRGGEGDFNCDTQIGLLDLDILGQNWGVTGADYTQGDANGDGEVGLLDLDTLGQNWGNTTSVPEPATLGLIALVGLTGIRRR